MNSGIKCRNCGAAIRVGNGKTSGSCPYCGSPVIPDENAFEFERFRLEHEEEVRRRKEKEDFRYIMILAGVLFVFLLITVLSYTVR